MNEEIFNTSIRQFLKKVGITSQREIEKAVWAQLDKKQLAGNETLPVNVQLSVPTLNLTLTVEDTIHLE